MAALATIRGRLLPSTRKLLSASFCSGEWKKGDNETIVPTPRQTGGYERAPFDRETGVGFRGSDENGTPSKTLFVRNLSYSTDPGSLQAVFKDATDVFLPKDRETGEMRGFGFITFEDVLAAENALKSLNGTTVDGRQVALRFAEEKAEGGRGVRRDRGGGGGYGRGGGGGGGYGRGGGGGGGYGRGGGGGGFGRGGDDGDGNRDGRGRSERSGRGGGGQLYDD